jgi:hypothetical protein
VSRWVRGRLASIRCPTGRTPCGAPRRP